MTRERWDSLWLEHFNRFFAEGRVVDRARIRATAEMEHRFGPRPELPEAEQGLRELPLKYRIAFNVVLARIRGLAPVEVDPMTQRIVMALIYGLTAAGPVLSAAFADSIISGSEWAGVASAFFVAAWGKFSSSTTKIMANRDGETFATGTRPPA